MRIEVEKVFKCTHLSRGHFQTSTTDNSLSSRKCYFSVSTHPCKAGSGFFKKCDDISGILTENSSGLGEPILWILLSSPSCSCDAIRTKGLFWDFLFN